MKRKVLIPALLMAAGVATAGGLYAQQSGVAQNDTPTCTAGCGASRTQS